MTDQKKEPQTLAGMSEEKIVEQARNYCIAIGTDPDRIVTGEDAKKYLDYIGQDVEHARRKGWNTDCWLPLIALGCALALSACAIPQPRMIWATTNGKGDAAFATDRFECLKVADASNPPAVGVGIDPLGYAYQYDMNDGNKDQLFGACMNAKGWKFVAVQ